MEYRWRINEKADPSAVEILSKEINVNQTLSNMLVNRGITDFQEAKEFFRPDIEKLHNPFLMKDMDKAVERLSQALDRGEKILIYGDYDVDGTTAVALVYGFLKSFYDHVDFYIPDRYKEGYGVSEKGIQYAAENNFKLIVSLDCGIKALGKIDMANALGVDFIICDHHTPGEEIPNAIAVLDPKRKDCPYPYKELSGCGVGFKLIQAYSIYKGLDAVNLYEFLDLVAVSIAADIVPITGENRIMAYYGLERINNNPRPGLKALMQNGKIEKEIEIGDIVFKIGPRINASGRMEHAKASVQLLISKDLNDAIQRASLVEDVNASRKNFDENITKEALDMISLQEITGALKSTVLFKQDWHKGVIGIVASRCIEQYYRPTIILTESNNKATGSARSVVDFDIYEAISECSDLLEQFGGHTFAAGLTLLEDQYENFKQAFEEVVQKRLGTKTLKPEIQIDAELKLDQIGPKLMKQLNWFAPFGPGNPLPVFLARGLRDSGHARGVGSQGEHLKAALYQDGGRPLGAIGFGLGHKLEMVREGETFDAVFSLDENHWNGSVEIQMILKDLR